MRKSIFIIVSLIISLFLVSCVESDYNDLEVDFILKEEVNGIMITLNHNFFDDVIESGVIYSQDKLADLNLDNVSNNVIIDSDEEEYYISDIDVSNYDKDYYIVGYIKLKDEKVIYSKKYQTSLLNLALKEISSFASRIVNEYNLFSKVINEVYVDVDLVKYKAISLSDNLECEITTDYKVVNVFITVINDFSYSNNLVFYFNNELIDSENYLIEGNLLTYKYNDPNWSGIY